MDPHSRISQFNQRAPRTGPQASKSRFMDPPAAKTPLDNFSKARKASGSTSTASLVRRAIASNSRIRQDEKTNKDMYLTFVETALRGDIQRYDELVNHFSPKQRSTSADTSLQPLQLRRWITALSHVVSRLERRHSALVEAIVNLPWTTMDPLTVKSYTVFSGMLLSAKPEYLSLFLGKIAQGFTHYACIQSLEASFPEVDSPTPLTPRVIYDRLHYLLRHLLSLIPTLPSTLMPLLVRNFPHKRQKQAAQSSYIRNLLRVSEYCPELADKILSTIVDRTIQIDVEIQVELEELEDEDQEPIEDDVFELDPFDTLVGEEDSDSDGDNEDDEDDNFSDLSSNAGDMDDVGKEVEAPRDVRHIQDMVKKLDVILALIFDHFHRASASPPMLNTSISSLTPVSELPPLPPFTPLSASSSYFPTFPPIDLPDLMPPPSTQPPPNTHSLIPTPLPDSNPLSPLTPAPASSQVPSKIITSKSRLRAQFHTLLSIFDRTILRTFKSRYTQFLLFWYTSLDPEFSDVFQGMLVDCALFQPSAPTVTRAAAASYIGSFVSRATFVDKDGVRRVVGVLCEFLRCHLEAVNSALLLQSRSSSAAGTDVLANVAQNSVFYAVAQAVFLIFCFRWRDLMEDEDLDELIGGTVGAAGKAGKKWMKELMVVQRVVNSVLNPLKVCSPNVAMQFARVAQATDFVYCYTILESNKRSEYASNSTDNRTSPNGARPLGSVNSILLGDNFNAELTTFFPFDPYKLPKSGVYIQGVYRDWTSVAIDDDEDDDSDDDEDEDEQDEGKGEEDRTSQYRVPASGRSSLDIPRPDNDEASQGLGVSFDAMSISPVRPGLQGVYMS